MDASTGPGPDGDRGRGGSHARPARALLRRPGRRRDGRQGPLRAQEGRGRRLRGGRGDGEQGQLERRDRKSTRLNSSHGYISYAVFCLKKKKKNKNEIQTV